MLRSVRLPLSLLLLGAAVPALAVPRLTTLDDARAALLKVRGGDTSLLEPTRALLARLSEAAPDDPVALAYLGLTTAFCAWHAPAPQAAPLTQGAVAAADHALRLARAAGGKVARTDGEVFQLSVQTYLAVARLDFMRAMAGDPSAVDRADALFTRAAELDAGDPLPLAYRGVVSTVRAGRSVGDEGGPLVLRGLELLDDALARAGRPDRHFTDREPTRAETRLVAAAAFIALPDEAFHRFDQGRALVEAELASPCIERLPPRLRAQLHFQASLVARHQGIAADEVAHLRAYVAMAPPDDPFSSVARARLGALQP